MRRYNLYKRGNLWYARLYNPLTKKYFTAKSTGKTDRQAAEYIALGWVLNGWPEGKERVPRKSETLFSIDELITQIRTLPFIQSDIEKILDALKGRGFIGNTTIKKNDDNLIDFLNVFWDYEKSPYVKEKLAYGHKITKGHCLDQANRIKNHWATYFKGRDLAEITKQDLKDFSIHLSKKKKLGQKRKVTDIPLSVGTINRILKAGCVALTWAYKNDYIQVNPAADLIKFSGTAKKRGILTDAEINKLFTVGNWADNSAAKLGNILAMVTGMRAGEIVALQVQDILEDRICVRHSWSRTDGLKSTKTGEERQIPILPEIRGQLLDHAKMNPHGCFPETYIFWSYSLPDQPIRPETFLLRLDGAMESIGISSKAKKERGLCFHSWRHKYTKVMAEALDERAMRLTGHKTSEVFEAYAHHLEDNDFQKAIDATGQVFGKILQFKTEATA